MSTDNTPPQSDRDLLNKVWGMVEGVSGWWEEDHRAQFRSAVYNIRDLLRPVFAPNREEVLRKENEELRARIQELQGIVDRERMTLLPGLPSKDGKPR